MRLHPGDDGSPAWSIQDPLSNRFYRIGWFEFRCLLRLPGAPAAIAGDISRSTPLAADAEMVTSFVDFSSGTTCYDREASLQGVRPRRRQLSWKNWQWWLHHYLFIRVPLVKPDRVLSRCLPWVRPLLAAGLVPHPRWKSAWLFLVARRWDEFTHALSDSFTPAGMAAFALAA